MLASTHECGRYAVFGEVYGQVQDLKYGVVGVRFAAFDVWDRVNGGFVDAAMCFDLLAEVGIPRVPRAGIFTVEADGTYAAETLREWSNGKSILGAGLCVREGIVIRWMATIGVVCLYARFGMGMLVAGLHAALIRAFWDAEAGP